MWVPSLLVALVGCMTYVFFTKEADGRIVRSMVTCPKPTVKNGQLFEDKALYVPGDADEILCVGPYRLVGKDRIKCNRDGTWSSNPPYCENITCHRPPRIMNGSVELKEPALIQTVAKFHCNQRFVLVGPPSLECGVHGKWIPDRMPRCEEVRCPHLPEMHGLKPKEHPTVGGYVEFDCDEGFVLIGNAVLHCAKNGSWVPNVIPYCKDTTCEETTDVFKTLSIILWILLIITVIAIVMYKKRIWIRNHIRSCNQKKEHIFVGQEPQNGHIDSNDEESEQ